ncbi:MAG: S1 RNA-binding domain-containing protein [Spirochaetes bacterium]|nr:S1 RNA-binding domain-containing protein [Spirochaetota bacterium]
MEELSFEQMLEQSFQNEKFNTGDRVKGKIISVSDEFAFVDITGKTEAVVSISEITDKKGNKKYSVNDECMFYISDISHDEIKLTIDIGLGYISDALIRFCFEENIPVKGKIISSSDAGFQVAIGENTAFCPLTHLESALSDDRKIYNNRIYDFSIIELKSGGRNIVVSRKDIIETVKAEETGNLKNSLKIGQIIETQITRIENYGIFVKVGPFEGLIHKSELSLSRIITPESFSPGDSIKAMVKEIDWTQNKFSLSIKDTFKDPWKNRIDEYETDKIYPATAVKFIKSGAFLELEPGIEGYLPVQRMSFTKRILSPEEFLRINNKYDVKIIEISRSDRKILLEIASDESNPWNSGESLDETIHECVIEKKLPNGLIVRIENGMEGYIPKSEIQNFDSLSAGGRITAGTLEFDRQNKKLVLSPKAAEELKERREVDQYIKSADKKATTAALGDMFKDIFKNIKTD